MVIPDDKILIQVEVDKSKKNNEVFKDLENKGLDVGKAIEKNLSEGIAGLSGKFGGITKSVGLIGGAIALAGVALKEAFDLTIEGEKIRAINTQFNNLATQAGVSADALKVGFQNAADGLVDTEDILTSANKALVNLQVDANKLPETFELARKSAALFGGDILNNFELINQAIATGQTRSLKQIGLIIDSTKAQKDYAQSLGVSVASLTEAGKQQAVLNAILEKGQKNFSSVDADVAKTQNAFTRFKVSVGELKDSFSLLFDNSIFQKFFNAVANGINAVSDSININFNKANLGAADKAKLLSKEIVRLDENISNLQRQVDNAPIPSAEKSTIAMIDAIKKGREKIKLELELTNEEIRKKGTQLRDQETTPQLFDPKKVAEDRTKLLTELNNTQLAVADLKIKNSETEDQRQAAINEKKAIIEEQFQLRLAALRKTYGDLNLTQTAEFHALEDALDAQRKEALAQRDEQFKARQAAVNTAFQQGITQTIVAGATRIGAALVKGGKAFDDFGKVVLGIIGDMVISIGTTLIGIGLGMEAIRASIAGLTGGPALFAGLALVALGGLLKSLSGGGSETPDTGGLTGGGVANTSGDNGIGSGVQQAEVKPQTNVTINVDRVLNRAEEALAIVDILNEHFDSNSGQLRTTTA